MNKRIREHRCVVLTTLLLTGAFVSPIAADETLPLVAEDDFQHGMSGWKTTDASYWHVVAEDEDAQTANQVLRVLGKSDYEPPHRSPHSIAWLKEPIVSDFELTARVQSTDRDSGAHRDMCIFWGGQDPAHFYYVHLGAQADPAACQIFIVDGAARRAITVKEVDGTPWTDDWHQVKVVRKVEDGSIEVYFDDMEHPFMTARDDTFKWGRVGLGTFDNHGNWDDFQLRGVVEPGKEF